MLIENKYMQGMLLNWEKIKLIKLMQKMTVSAKTEKVKNELKEKK